MKNYSMIRAAGAAIALIFAAGAASAQPKLEIVGGDTHDWGKVAPAKLTTVVEVKNTGNADLNITDVRPGCSCTASLIDKNLLKPGESARINVSLDAASRPAGPIEKIVTITSNDSAAPSRILHLKADIYRAVTVSPAQYMLVNNAVLGTEITAAPLTIKNTGDAPLTIQVPKLTNGNVKMRFDMKEARQLKPGEQFVLTAYVTPQDAQSVQGTVTMATSDKDIPSLDIHLSGTMAPAPQLSSTKPASQK
jgi:hypothetical protein